MGRSIKALKDGLSTRSSDIPRRVVERYKKEIEELPD